MGYPLFYRERGQLTLSEAGQRLLPFWREMLQKQANALQEASNLMKGRRQTIHVGCISISPIYDMIADAICRTTEDGWDKHFLVEHASFKKLRLELEDGKRDCILSLSDELRELSSEYVQTPLAVLHPALIISRQHPLYREDMTVKDVENATIYVLSTKFAYNAELNVLRCCKYYGFVPRDIRYFDDVASLEMALYAGQGIALIYPEFLRNPTGMLARFPIDIKMAEANELTLAYHRDKAEAMAPFIEALKRRAAEKTVTAEWL